MNVFIGCSSSNDLDDIYYDIGRKVSKELAKDNDLVFGGYDSGIMGICYHEFKTNNKLITAVVAKPDKKDLDSLDCDISIISDSVTSRSHDLFINSDILVFLPGGIGTIVELFTSLEEKRNNIIDVPIIIYNEDNYFDKILSIINDIKVNRFSSCDNLFEVVNSIEGLNNLLNKNKVKEKRYE